MPLSQRQQGVLAVMARETNAEIIVGDAEEEDGDDAWQTPAVGVAGAPGQANKQQQAATPLASK